MQNEKDDQMPCDNLHLSTTRATEAREHPWDGRSGRQPEPPASGLCLRS
jgi:hypothetical protein